MPSLGGDGIFSNAGLPASGTGNKRRLADDGPWTGPFTKGTDLFPTPVPAATASTLFGSDTDDNFVTMFTDPICSGLSRLEHNSIEYSKSVDEFGPNRGLYG